jgi:CRP-like cAMP-binding protein
MSLADRPPRIEPGLEPVAVARRLPKGAHVFRQGDRARAVFFVVEGEVQLRRAGRRGEGIVLHRARAGEYFAEASPWSERYHCDALAVRPVRLAEIPAGHFRRALRDDPELAARWVALLSRLLQGARARAERTALTGAEERIRHYLETNGSGARREVTLSGALKDLAAELGIAHETLYRALARMGRRGVIERDGARLRLGRAGV